MEQCDVKDCRDFVVCCFGGKYKQDKCKWHNKENGDCDWRPEVNGKILVGDGGVKKPYQSCSRMGCVNRRNGKTMNEMYLPKEMLNNG